MSTLLKNLLQPAPDSLACQQDKDGRIAHWILFNLVWTVWVFVDGIFQDQIGREWVIATALSFATFLVLYFGACLRPVRRLGYFALGMVLLGFATMHWNHSGGTTYIIYACSYLAFFGTVRQGMIAAGVTAMGYMAVAYLFGWPWVVILPMTMVALSVAAGNVMHRISAQKDAALRLSHEEVRRLAATAERERIGRDLHDLLGHTLSLIALKSELANKLFDRDAATAKREMADVERVARDALAQVRRAVTGIRAAGFAAELASARLLLESNGVQLDYALSDVAMPVEIETVLAMAVREAVTNIQRHARATQAHIALEAAQGKLLLRIEDNGRGGAIVPGNGLAGMRERLATIGAQLGIESQRGQGTKLMISAPLPQAETLLFSPREKVARSAG